MSQLTRGVRVVICGVFSAGLLAGCATQSSRQPPQPMSSRYTSAFEAVVRDYQAELKREPVHVEFVVIPEAVAYWSQWPPGLIRALEPLSTEELAARSEVISALGIETGATLEWKGCPTFKSMNADMSRCPARPRAEFAVGVPDFRALLPVDSVVLGRPLAEGEALVRTAVTFIDRGGAHTRFRNLLIRRESMGWVVVRGLAVAYIE